LQPLIKLGEMRKYPGRVIKTTLTGVAILLAVSSDGVIFFQFMEGKNNQDIVELFLLRLIEHYDKIKPNWGNTHIILMEKMSSHKKARTLSIV
jgi:hypothetical protein